MYKFNKSIRRRKSEMHELLGAEQLQSAPVVEFFWLGAIDQLYFTWNLRIDKQLTL